MARSLKKGPFVTSHVFERVEQMNITGKKDVCMANAESVKTLTGFTIGGVSPIGLNNKIEIMIDNQLSRFKDIYAAAGHPNAIFKIDLENLVRITSGKIMEISE